GEDNALDIEDAREVEDLKGTASHDFELGREVAFTGGTSIERTVIDCVHARGSDGREDVLQVCTGTRVPFNVAWCILQTSSVRAGFHGYHAMPASEELQREVGSHEAPSSDHKNPHRSTPTQQGVVALPLQRAGAAHHPRHQWPVGQLGVVARDRDDFFNIDTRLE